MSPPAVSTLSTTNAPVATDPLYEARVVPDPHGCFHCGDPIPTWAARPGQALTTLILGQPRPMCCLGCQLASQSIVEAGLESYYLDRTEISRTAPLPQPAQSVAADDPAWQSLLLHEDQEGVSAELSVTGLRCAACGWLVERRLQQDPAIMRASLNVATGHLKVLWRGNLTQHDGSLGEVIRAVQSVGYQALPYRQDNQAISLQRTARQMLIRLGVAGLGAMQAMMFAVALYLGAYSGIDADFKRFLQWVSLGVSLPVVIYAGWPFYVSAWHALRLRTVNMDVPVSIALILTSLASIYATITQTGETYFDSVSMFVFFLLTGRFLEIRARQAAATSRQQALGWQPTLAHLHTGAGDHVDHPTWESVPASRLQPGDRIEIRAGETIPCDAKVIMGSGQVSEALLTGESTPCFKQPGDRLIGGSQNYQSVLQAEVIAPASQSQMALLERLMNRALQERPAIQQQADRMSRWFVLRILVLALVVGLGWWYFDPDRALWAVVAVLVATCPCALSLATPLALSVATARLAQLGLLVTRGHVIETLAQADTIVLDKTGTLTSGQPQLVGRYTLNEVEADHWVQVAAALEQSSTHPLALAFQQAVGHKVTQQAYQIMTSAGGVSGQLGTDHFRLGHAGFVDLAHCATHQVTQAQHLIQQGEPDWQWLYLVRHQDVQDTGENNPELVALFAVADRLRSEAPALTQQLATQGMTVQVLSGDPDLKSERWGQLLQLAPTQVLGGQTAQDKLDWVKARQQAGHQVMMLGDGVNDGLVLGGADVSVAMGQGADLAQLHADSVLTADQLTALPQAIALTRRTQDIIRQNLRWAVTYNMAVLLPAALGYVPPWLAAIGMSLSSVLVVLNALRLRRLPLTLTPLKASA